MQRAHAVAIGVQVPWNQAMNPVTQRHLLAHVGTQAAELLNTSVGVHLTYGRRNGPSHVEIFRFSAGRDLNEDALAAVELLGEDVLKKMPAAFADLDTGGNVSRLQLRA